MASVAQELAFAHRQLGVPYQWGGESRRTGFDCSGLVWAALRAAGYTGVGRTTYQQLKQGRAVSRGQLVPGDLVFPEAGHVGIYAGNGMIIEAPHTGDHVKMIPLADFGFWQARRLIAGGGGVRPPMRNGRLDVRGPQVAASHFASIIQTVSQAQQQAQIISPSEVAQRVLGSAPPLPTPQQTLSGLSLTTPNAPAVHPGQAETSAAAGSLDALRRSLLSA